MAGRPPSPAWPTPWPAGRTRCGTWASFPEAGEDARRALAVAREVGYPFGEVVALLDLALAAAAVGDLSDAVLFTRHHLTCQATFPPR